MESFCISVTSRFGQCKRDPSVLSLYSGPLLVVLSSDRNRLADHTSFLSGMHRFVSSSRLTILEPNTKI